MRSVKEDAMNRNKKLVILVLLFVSIIVSFIYCGGDGDRIALSDVSPLYSTNGADWNDYVKGRDIKNATDMACDADMGTACMHGGEIRKVELTGVPSCTGITASDALDAFNWTCDDSTSTARIISNGLTSGYGLANLVDFVLTGWKKNSLTVYKDGVEIGTTTPAVWWSNPVVVNTTGDALDAEGTVYVVPSNTIATAYEFTASSVSLVAAPGVLIRGPAGGWGSYVIKATGMDFLWVEGMAINAAGDDVGIYWDTVRFSAIRNLSAEHADTGSFPKGIYLISSSNNTLSGVDASNNGWYGVILGSSSSNNMLSGVTASNNDYGIWLASSSDNTLSGVAASNNGQYGIVLAGSSDNTITNMEVSNNSCGVWLASSSNNTLSGVDASNNRLRGVSIYQSSNNILSGVTASNNGQLGVNLDSSSNNTLTGVTANNNGVGVSLASSSNNTISGVVASNNISGIHFVNSSDNYFTGDLKVGSNATGDCGIIGGTNPGLMNSTCVNDGVSDAALTTGVTIASSFVAKVTTDDSANTSDTNGAAAITDITQTFDWTSFDNTYRTWGVDGSAFPDATNRGSLGCSDTTYANQTDCEANTGTWRGDARIWDWSLAAADTVIKDALSLPTGNDTLTHTWSDASTSAILRNSVEMQGDGIGNDNTLCETSEDCLYTPNIGSYQGHGSLITAGSIGTGGTIENVTLWKYETNGY